MDPLLLKSLQIDFLSNFNLFGNVKMKMEILQPKYIYITKMGTHLSIKLKIVDK